MAQTAGINRFSISVLHITTGLFWTQNNWNTHRHILPENPSYFSSFDGFFPCPTWLTWFRSSRYNADRCQLVQSRSHTRYRLLMACLCVHRGGGFGTRVGEGHRVGRHHQRHVLTSSDLIWPHKNCLWKCVCPVFPHLITSSSQPSLKLTQGMDRERKGEKKLLFFSIWI